MARNTTHELQPKTDHDGISRRLSVLANKRAIRAVLEQKLRADYEQQVLSTRTEEPQTAADIAEETMTLDSYRRWACASRASQDRMWSLLAEQIDVDYERIDAAAQNELNDPCGSLKLAGARAIPEYLATTTIHGQPGGYMLQRTERDLAAGLLYEAGGNIYAMGQGIGKRDSKGERLIAHVRQRYPDFSPRRILEMGCSAGGQSVDYPRAFPDAEFHAIDASAGMLRYAHARAEILGAKVHFHQADAAATTFPDGHFDLVISHNLFHEVAAEHMPKIMRESYRLLAPGGVCIHQDVPIQTKRFDPFMQFFSEWQKDNNDEPFWLDFANANLPAMMKDAGFEAEKISEDYIPALDGPIPWYVVSARREA